MRTSEKLKLAWPALLKLADYGQLIIYGRGINEKEERLYEVPAVADTALLTAEELLDRLATDKKESDGRS